MRTTTHSMRIKGAKANHNDRQFDLDKAEHIDQALLGKNAYWCIYPELSFGEAEKKFYERTFKKMIADINERAVKSRHIDRKTSASKLLTSAKTMPENVIFQIGNKDNFQELESKKVLIDVYREYIAWHDAKFKGHVVALNRALHCDEPDCPYHIHERRVWKYTDEKGVERIGQNKALEQMGYTLPDPSKPRGRNNNLKMVYTAECRQKWLEICRKHGLELEEKPLKKPLSKQNLKKEEYVAEKLKEEIKSLLASKERVQDECDNLELGKEALADEYKELQKAFNKLKADYEELEKAPPEKKVVEVTVKKEVEVPINKDYMRDCEVALEALATVIDKLAEKGLLPKLEDEFMQDETIAEAVEMIRYGRNR